jgi:hypothetical protein
MASDEETEALVTVVSRPSERSANEAARLLVEHGMGAVVERLEPEETGDEGAVRTTGFAVRVLPHQVDRSCDLLGVAVPAEVVAAAEEAKEPAPPWRRIVLIWAIAMITIPVVAGFGAYFLLSR